MVDRSEGLSRSVEDYLKAIFALTEPDEPASTSAIAEALDVQPASVTGMVKRLAESELVEYVPYRGVRLTELGSREALLIIRRHRILESYLVGRLGYSWDDVHAEAERLEHAASDDLIERMATSLQNPSHDPHGAPIPTPAGEIEPTSSATLADAPVGVPAQIRAVADEDSDRLRAMEARGLMPGAIVEVVARGADDGSIEVRIGGEGGPEHFVRTELAMRVFVTALDPAAHD